MILAIDVTKNAMKTMKQKRYFLGLIVASLLIVCLYLLASYGDFDIRDTFSKIYMSEENYFTKQSHRIREYRKRGVKTILRWNTFFGNKNFYFGEGDIFRNCPVDKCEIFNDRDYLNVKDYDAILFHGNELEKDDMPRERDTGQFYVYVNLESPASRPIIDRLYENFFNLTMTYYFDSDIPWTYYIIKDINNGKIIAPSKNADWSIFPNSTNVDKMPPKILDVVSGKNKLVSWFVSNCKASSGRLDYANELSRYIGVDIYGKCGKFSCNRNQHCFGDIVEPNYFFYLSFENTLCDDYVTEKLMNPFRYNVVPVVYGGVNYSHFAPPNSYVNALDFESPKDLAAYLQDLSRDLQRYQSYLEWKKYYRIETGTERAVCTLCEVLHKQKRPKMYTSLSNWYIKDRCPIQTYLNNIADKYMTKTTLTNRE